MKTNKFLYIPIIVFVLASCSKSNSPTVVSSTSAKSTFSNVNTDIATAVKTLNEAPGTVALNSFDRLNNSTIIPVATLHSSNALESLGNVTGMIDTKIASLRMVLLKNTATDRIESNASFDFKSNIGTYSWNSTKHKWHFAPDPKGSIIKFDYPSDLASSINDTELQIAAYTETKIGRKYYPTHIQLAVYKPVGGTKEVDLSITASGYSDAGIPNQKSIICYINPYSISFNFDNTQSLIANASCSFIKGSTTYIEANLATTFTSVIDQVKRSNPNKVTGFLQLENTKFNAVIDGTKLCSSTDLNDYANITVTIDGGSAGHVIWVTDPQLKKQVPYVEYNDKIKESLSNIFADLQTQLTSFGFKFL